MGGILVICLRTDIVADVLADHVIGSSRVAFLKLKDDEGEIDIEKGR